MRITPVLPSPALCYPAIPYPSRPSGEYASDALCAALDVPAQEVPPVVPVDLGAVDHEPDGLLVEGDRAVEHGQDLLGDALLVGEVRVGHQVVREAPHAAPDHEAGVGLALEVLPAAEGAGAGQDQVDHPDDGLVGDEMACEHGVLLAEKQVPADGRAELVEVVHEGVGEGAPGDQALHDVAVAAVDRADEGDQAYRPPGLLLVLGLAEGRVEEGRHPVRVEEAEVRPGPLVLGARRRPVHEHGRDCAGRAGQLQGRCQQVLQA
eukprot:754549-Hanusia_phi.AAC.2